jgi:hypothetical protein
MENTRNIEKSGTSGSQAEIRNISVRSQPEETVPRTLSQKKYLT